MTDTLSDADRSAGDAVTAPKPATGSRVFPLDHPQRFVLNDEVHARPPESLVAPMRVSYLALLLDRRQRETEWQGLCDLAQRFRIAAPAPGVSHYSADFGPFRLTWERHTEFSRYKFIVAGAGEDPFAEPAIAAVPADWLADLPGQTMVAAHVALARAGSEEASDLSDLNVIASRLFGGNALIGGAVAGGAAVALTDFRIQADGWSRFLVVDRSLTPRQAGRTIQRLLEIDTYKIMALLALPVARELVPFLAEHEQELARIAGAMPEADLEAEPVLLDRLTRVAAEVESREADNLYRFSAAAAYYELVRRRIEDLREQRIQGLQTFSEFIEQRLAPAMNTCRAVAARQDSLSSRVAHATQLLSTRVDLTRERQNQAVLESMNRRAKLQLRLQSTVEGLSVAAVTYYVVGLVGYAAKGLHSAGVEVNPELTMGIAIPIVAGAVAFGLHRIRRVVTRPFV